MKMKMVLILVGACIVSTIVGCNMFKGAGKDMENAGKSVQRTVDKND